MPNRPCEKLAECKVSTFSRSAQFAFWIAVSYATSFYCFWEQLSFPWYVTYLVPLIVATLFTAGWLGSKYFRVSLLLFLISLLYGSGLLMLYAFCTWFVISAPLSESIKNVKIMCDAAIFGPGSPAVDQYVNTVLAYARLCHVAIFISIIAQYLKSNIVMFLELSSFNPVHSRKERSLFKKFVKRAYQQTKAVIFGLLIGVGVMMFGLEHLSFVLVSQLKISGSVEFGKDFGLQGLFVFVGFTVVIFVLTPFEKEFELLIETICRINFPNHYTGRIPPLPANTASQNTYRNTPSVLQSFPMQNISSPAPINATEALHQPSKRLKDLWISTLCCLGSINRNVGTQITPVKSTSNLDVDVGSCAIESREEVIVIQEIPNLLTPSAVGSNDLVETDASRFSFFKV